MMNSRSVLFLLGVSLLALGTWAWLGTRGEQAAAAPAEVESEPSVAQVGEASSPLIPPVSAVQERAAAETVPRADELAREPAAPTDEAPVLGSLIIDLLEPGGAPNSEAWLTIVPVDVTEGPAELGTGSVRGLVGTPRRVQSRAIELDRVFDVWVVRDLSRPHGPFRVSGPTSAEEPARATIEVPRALVHVRLRLVDEEGHPAGGLRLQETIEWSPSVVAMNSRTLPDSGEVMLVFDQPPTSTGEPYGLAGAKWNESSSRQPKWRFSLDPPLGEGDHDLGDLWPWEPPLLARGRVVNEAGLAVEGARVSVEESAVSGGLVIPNSVARITQTDAEGRFEVRGELDVLPLTLSASGKRMRSDVVRVTEAGGPELNMEVRTLGLVRVLPPEGQGLPTLYWTPPGAELSGGRAFAARIGAPGPDGQVFGLPEGRYDCHVMLPRGVSLAVVRGVEFTAGEPFEDPRLNPLPGY